MAADSKNPSSFVILEQRLNCRPQRRFVSASLVQERGPLPGRRPFKGLQEKFLLRLARLCSGTVHSQA
jgi:hypothetical protein